LGITAAFASIARGVSNPNPTRPVVRMKRRRVRTFPFVRMKMAGRRLASSGHSN
jgi:hypothetical protein